eukprot:4003560-Amphidinium_carterae.1
MGANSRVLTCNHVLDIVLEHQATQDWRATFEKCVPGRKKFLEAAPNVALSGQPEEPLDKVDDARNAVAGDVDEPTVD